MTAPLPSLPALDTERLRLRSFVVEDAPRIAAYRSEPEVARYQSWTAPYTEEQAAQLVASMVEAPVGVPGTWYQIAITLRSTGELIGDSGICVSLASPSVAEIGFTLAPEFQRQGYGTEAMRRILRLLVEELGVGMVRANCVVENTRSARLLGRLGLGRVGEPIRVEVSDQVIEEIWFETPAGWRP
jgi:aminoglycoside 6'-N-acetyltransferase